MRWAIEGETRQVGGEEEDSSGGEIFGIEEDGSRMGDVVVVRRYPKY